MVKYRKINLKSQIINHKYLSQAFQPFNFSTFQLFLMQKSELEDEIRQIVLSSVEVEGLTAADLESDIPLVGPDGVGLDSIDALEIGVALRKKYNVKFKANSAENRAYFKSISSLASFIAENTSIQLEG